MKSIKEKLNENIIDDQKIDEVALYGGDPYRERLHKQMNDAWVPKSIIEIIDQTKFPNGLVKFDTLVEILCEIYKDKFNK